MEFEVKALNMFVVETTVFSFQVLHRDTCFMYLIPYHSYVCRSDHFWFVCMYMFLDFPNYCII